MRSKLILVLLLTLALVSAKTHLKRNSKTHQHQGPNGGAQWSTEQYNSSWDQSGQQSSTQGTQEGSTWGTQEGSTWGTQEGSTWDNQDNSSGNTGDQSAVENFDPANQTQIDEFQESTDNQYVESTGNLDEFEQTFNNQQIDSRCFEGFKREEVELFLFQGYVRYLSDLYWTLESERWWAAYYAEWSSYYSEQYTYEQQYPAADEETQPEDEGFQNDHLIDFVNNEFVPSSDTVEGITQDYADISQAGKEGYDGQLVVLVQLRNKFKSKSQQEDYRADEEYQAALSFFKIGYMTGFIDGYLDYSEAARNFVHLSFYDQSLFATYLGQVQAYLESTSCYNVQGYSGQY